MVVSDLASRPGFRYATQYTPLPSRILVVSMAAAVSVAIAS